MVVSIPSRQDVPEQFRWNLSALFPTDAAWEIGLADLTAKIGTIERLKNQFCADKAKFKEILAFYSDYMMLEERLGYYAHLRMTEDEGNSESRGRFARYMGTATQGQGTWAWFIPAIHSLDTGFISDCIEDRQFADYKVFLQKLLRFKPHVLSEKEEKLLALQSEANQTSQETFGVLTNVDLDFGTVDTEEGPRPLTQSTFASFMRNKNRDIRQKAYFQFYGAYEKHKNTLASLYAGSVKLDKYQAQVRNYTSAREQALFPDNVPEAVYDNLVQTIHDNLPALHRYYELRKRILKVDELRHYDVYVPLVEEKKSRHTYEEAVDIVTEALAPLGEEYVSTLRKGLLGSWVDRYENKGKRSGAFSAGSFCGEPYILLNYKEDVLRDVFTMAHEGGHSMHSWYSARNNPFLCYSYTIFEAEVASTLNEQLVFKYLYERSNSEAERASLLANRIDDTLATLFRQTMFAEFEAITHAMAERGEPLTVDSLRSVYRKLLQQYFGPSMKLEDVSDLEGLRIPHFYNAFYVYKYSTGISASIALSERILHGGKAELDDYFAFLKSGGSRFPIEALKVAGVDMATPQPIEMACQRFAKDVETLWKLLDV